MRKEIQLEYSTKDSLRAMGRRIRDVRHRRNYTMQEAADESGISTSMLHRIEAGDPSVSVAALVSVLYTIGHDTDLKEIGKENYMDEVFRRK